MGYKIDLTGQRFGRWTVLEFDTNKMDRLIGNVDVIVEQRKMLMEPG